MLRKVIAAGSIFMSVAIHAGTMGCVPGNVTVLCPEKKWDLGVSALYLRPSHDASTVYESLFNFQPVSRELQSLEHDWDWGYRINGSYHFGQGNDISMDWSHFQDTTQLAPRSFTVGTLTTNLAFDLQNQFDQVNLVLGQHINHSRNHSVRLFGGLQAVQIKNNWVVPAEFILPGPTINNLVFTQDRKFSGVGATFGTDYAYHLYNGFSLTATGRMAMLYGVQKTNLRTTAPNAAPGVVVASTYASKRAMVPELEMKTGVNYAHPVAYGTLNLNLGYLWINYFNAVLHRTVGPVAQLINADQGYDGAYFGVHFVSNAV